TFWGARRRARSEPARCVYSQYECPLRRKSCWLLPTRGKPLARNPARLHSVRSKSPRPGPHRIRLPKRTQTPLAWTPTAPKRKPSFVSPARGFLGSPSSSLQSSAQPHFPQQDESQLETRRRLSAQAHRSDPTKSAPHSGRDVVPTAPPRRRPVRTTIPALPQSAPTLH